MGTCVGAARCGYINRCIHLDRLRATFGHTLQHNGPSNEGVCIHVNSHEAVTGMVVAGTPMNRDVVVRSYLP